MNNYTQLLVADLKTQMPDIEIQTDETSTLRSQTVCFPNYIRNLEQGLLCFLSDAVIDDLKQKQSNKLLLNTEYPVNLNNHGDSTTACVYYAVG